MKNFNLNKHQKLLFAICTAMNLLAPNAMTQTPVIRIGDSSEDLAHIAKYAKEASYFTSKAHRGRLESLRTYSIEAIEKIRIAGIGHRESLQEIQRVVFVCKYSKSFLSRTSSEITRPIVDSIISRCDFLANRHGFSQMGATNLLEMAFRQIYQTLIHLEGNTLVPVLANLISKIRPELGRVIAQAGASGDRPNTFDAVEKIFPKLDEITQVAQTVALSEAQYQANMELVELIEFIRHFAQIQGDRP